MIEELIAEINRRGLRVNNLCQLHDDSWQANITDGERFWEFGRAATAVEALTAALLKTTTTTPGGPVKPTKPNPPPPPTSLIGIL